MSDSSDEEHKGPVGNLKELLKDTTLWKASTENGPKVQQQEYILLSWLS